MYIIYMKQELDKILLGGKISTLMKILAGIGIIGIYYAAWNSDLIFIFFAILFSVIFTEYNYINNFKKIYNFKKIKELNFKSASIIKFIAFVLSLPLILVGLGAYSIIKVISDQFGGIIALITVIYDGIINIFENNATIIVGVIMIIVAILIYLYINLIIGKKIIGDKK